jgi:hypothetical protein
MVIGTEILLYLQPPNHVESGYIQGSFPFVVPNEIYLFPDEIHPALYANDGIRIWVCILHRPKGLLALKAVEPRFYLMGYKSPVF